MPEMPATIWLVANLRVSLGGSSGGNPYPAGIHANRRRHGESGIRSRREGSRREGGIRQRAAARQRPDPLEHVARMNSFRALPEDLFASRAKS